MVDHRRFPPADDALQVIATRYPDSASTPVSHEEVLRWYDAVHWHQGVWTPDIVLALWDGPKRAKELYQRAQTSHVRSRWAARANPISQNALHKALRALVRDELVQRTSYGSGFFKEVWYELTPLALDFFRNGIRTTSAWVSDNGSLLQTIHTRRQQSNPPTN